MGHGDDDELRLSDAELAADEVAVRGLLARWGEPAPAAPPPALAAGVIATIEGRPRVRRRGPLALVLPLSLFGLLLALGLWGVLGDSLGPARLAGDPSAGLGQLLLGLTLAAKPLVNLLLGAGAAGVAAAVALFAGAALWWRLVRPAGAPMEAS